MAIYLVPIGGAQAVFIFDAEQLEELDLQVDWTQFPIEENAEITDFYWVKPEGFRVSGIVTETPLNEAPSQNRIGSVTARLRKIVKEGQPLTLVTRSWSETIVVKSVRASSGEADGEAVRVDIATQTIERVKSETVRIPPSRLRRRIRRQAAAKADPFQQAPRSPTPNQADRFGVTQQNFVADPHPLSANIPRVQ